MIFLGSSIGVGKDSGALTVFVFSLLVKCVGRIIPELGQEARRCLASPTYLQWRKPDLNNYLFFLSLNL